jgi:hypothetical protein
LARIAGVLVDIDLDQLDRPAGGGDRLFQGRGQLAARAAPGSPEIDDDGLGFRRLDDVGHEAGVGAILDVRAVAAAVGSTGLKGGGLFADQAHR